MKSSLIILFVSIICCWQQILADTPANCTYEDIKGLWLFEETEPIKDRWEKCPEHQQQREKYSKKIFIRLDFPNVAVDKFGNIGEWTMIYNQGFEVKINYRKYFAFSAYERKSENNVLSYCHKTQPGWSHDVLGNNWACYVGHKVNNWNDDDVSKTTTVGAEKFPVKQHSERELYLQNINVEHILSQKHIDHLNSQQKSWKAIVYPDLQSKSIEHLIQMAGGRKSRIINRPKPLRATEQQKQLARSLPESFDWRNLNGIDYVSPVRDQGKCGSCYTFASMAMLESRIRIQTNNTFKPIFSTQEVVDCSEYSQGCDGGFSYLIAGKYAQDFGVIDESCYPYKGVTGKCQNQQNFNQTNEKCKQRTYTIDYKYVGGYFGACNEEAMQIELVQNGPIAVGFEVYGDFFGYSEGIYSHQPSNESNDQHQQIKAEFNPFEMTNHAVLIVGYGKDKKTGEKYWIVKNSWGKQWGMDGYFWMRRGTDECAIESLAMAATPIPN
ncbi:dipeptidyl peptidase 1-like [Dermatophagoides pteronyssinus]|uniref:dipeptidyl peptidase 1-like n=1 Tax=Dermatophagoides pteronyssinus TaxID=6956 RepID=UPI003F671CE3